MAASAVSGFATAKILDEVNTRNLWVTQQAMFDGVASFRNTADFNGFVQYDTDSVRRAYCDGEWHEAFSGECPNGHYRTCKGMAIECILPS